MRVEFNNISKSIVSGQNSKKQNNISEISLRENLSSPVKPSVSNLIAHAGNISFSGPLNLNLTLPKNSETIKYFAELLLQHHPREIKYSAIKILGSIKRHDAADALIEGLSCTNRNVKIRIIAALENTKNPESRKALNKILNGEDDELKLFAAVSLGNMGYKEAIPELIKGLDHTSDYKRSMSVVALGNVGEPEAIPDIIKVLKDNNEIIAAKASEALQKIGMKLRQG
ncbi:MAG: HEAT repeat domain-containing protein [Candidatus Gastranaerophilales bacterium]|nr:HEAT repeat domain-containing protein [Candidatus Gastranaerophilales bacterium]